MVQPPGEDLPILAHERAKRNANDNVVEYEPNAVMEPSVRLVKCMPRPKDRITHLMYFEMDRTVRALS